MDWHSPVHNSPLARMETKQVSYPPASAAPSVQGPSWNCLLLRTLALALALPHITFTMPSVPTTSFILAENMRVTRSISKIATHGCSKLSPLSFSLSAI